MCIETTNNIQKKAENVAYSKEDLRNAVEEVRSGIGVSIRATAQKYRNLRPAKGEERRRKKP